MSWDITQNTNKNKWNTDRKIIIQNFVGTLQFYMNKIISHLKSNIYEYNIPTKLSSYF